MLVLDKDTYIEQQIKNQATKKIKLFYGSKDDNLQAKDENTLLIPDSEILVKMKTPKYEGSEAYEEHWRDINNLRKKFDPQNIAHTPADLNTLIQLYIMDITRQTMEQIDYTSRLTIENTDYNYPKSISLRDLFKYRAKFKRISGAGDRAPLVQQATGEIRSIIMGLWGAGWVSTLDNLLFNSLYDMQKVLTAISEAYILERNDMTLGRIFARSLTTPSGWHVSQRQAAINATGNTMWENLYDTIYFAIEQLRQLRDPQNHKYIPVSSIVFLCHSTQLDKCRAVISGALERSGSQQGRGQLRGALDINEIWTYDGDSYTWGIDPITFEGCPTNRFYVFVPRSSWYTAVKRPITMEVGRGSVLSYGQEERSWYFCQTDYDADFFGSSAVGATSTGEGFIIEGEIPTVVEET